MYPDLLGIFGITLYGVTFERVVFGALALLMLWGVASTISIAKQGRKGEAAVQGLIVLAVLVASGRQFLATFGDAYPLVFQSPIVLHSYAFCVLVGVVCGISSAVWMAPHRQIEKMWVIKLCLWFVVIGMIGARLAHLVVDYQTYIDSCFHPELAGLSEPNCLRAFDVSEGGLTFYGGVIAGFFVVLVAVILQRKKNPEFSVLQLTDLLAASLAVAHGFGRIGCIAAGCCWGAITASGRGLHYEEGSFAYQVLLKDPKWHDAIVASGQTPGMHATQLYEAGAELMLFALLCFIAHRQHKRIAAGEKISYGVMTGIWFAGYGLVRIILECVRDDEERGYFFRKVVEPVNNLFDVSPDHVTFFTTSQGIGVGMVLIGLTAIFLSKKLCKKRD